MIRVIGVDPGLRCTGYGVIETDGYRHRYLGSDQICPGSGPIPQRLGMLFRQLSEALEVYAPDCAAVETSFVSANAGTALKLGQARGALISACVMRQVEVFEYAPRSMKQAITGRGGATKEQVQFHGAAPAQSRRIATGGRGGCPGAGPVPCTLPGTDDGGMRHMIAYLRGPVTYRQPPELVVEAGGVGYRVLASMAAFDRLPQDDSEVVLPTLLVVRENAHTLFGFADEAERQRFSQLLRISGVGAKTALAILSALPGATLRHHVESGTWKG